MWTKALAARGDWAGVGNIKRIYRPCRELLSRWQKSQQAAYNLRKRPNLTEAVTLGLIVGFNALEKECERLEKIVTDRETEAKALGIAQAKPAADRPLLR